jgi:hypothetical protein
VAGEAALSELAMRNKKKKLAIHFKFNQGFSNAVRRIVTIDEIL